MKYLIYLGSCLFLAIGMFYGFASAINIQVYEKILIVAIILEILAIAGFTYWFFCSNGWLRIVPIFLGCSAIYTLGQAVIRLIRILLQ